MEKLSRGHRSTATTSQDVSRTIVAVSRVCTSKHSAGGCFTCCCRACRDLQSCRECCTHQTGPREDLQAFRSRMHNMTARRQPSSASPVIRASLSGSQASRGRGAAQVRESRVRSAGSALFFASGSTAQSTAAANPGPRSQVTEEPRQRRRSEQRGAPGTPAAEGAHGGPTGRARTGGSSKTPCFT